MLWNMLAEGSLAGCTHDPHKLFSLRQCSNFSRLQKVRNVTLIVQRCFSIWGKNDYDKYSQASEGKLGWGRMVLTCRTPTSHMCSSKNKEYSPVPPLSGPEVLQVPWSIGRGRGGEGGRTSLKWTMFVWLDTNNIDGHAELFVGAAK